MLRAGRVMRFESAVNLDLLKEYSRSSFRSGTINLDVQIVPIRQGAHSLNDCLIQLQDVTARKQAEAGFDLYKILLENTLSSLDEAIFLLDLRKMTIDDANGTAEQIFGYSRDEMVGKPVTILHASQDTADNQFSPDAMADVESGGYREFECGMKRQDGEIFPAQVLIRPIRRGNAKPEKSVYVVRDLTDRREVEDELRRREHHYRTLAEAARDLVFVFNHDDKIMYINRYAARICGSGSRSLIGRPRRDLFPDYVADLQGMKLRKVFESGRTVHTEEKLPDTGPGILG